MIRANIYSLETLAPPVRDAVHEGIQTVAAYMGQAIVANELRVRLPLTETGAVNPHKVGFGNMDRMVDLHLMAVPVDAGDGDVLGASYTGRGLAFADTSVFENTGEPDTKLIRTTTAHETAHAFGFVLKDSAQSSPDSPRHCSDQSCTMHAEVVSDIVVKEPATVRQLLTARILRRTPGTNPSTPYFTRVYRQFDFCQPCKSDMYNHGEENLAKMRFDRLTSNKKGV